MNTTCGHCHEEYDISDGHDCKPNCLHCGATFEDLEQSEYDHVKIAVSRHQRECDEQPEGWGKNIYDPESEWREERREKKRIRQWERKVKKEKHVW